MAASPATPIRAAIFDFDGTIADSIELTVDVYNSVAGGLGLRTVSERDVVALRRMRPMQALDFMEVPLTKLPALVRTVRRAMRARMAEVKPFGELTEVLREIARREVQCYVLSTNSTENIESFLAHHDMSFFRLLAGGSSLFGKARHLRKLVSRERLDPAHVYYVGDEVRDISAARDATVKSLAVTWGYSDRTALVAERPDYLVDAPHGLLDVFP